MSDGVEQRSGDASIAEAIAQRDAAAAASAAAAQPPVSCSSGIVAAVTTRVRSVSPSVKAAANAATGRIVQVARSGTVRGLSALSDNISSAAVAVSRTGQHTDPAPHDVNPASTSQGILDSIPVSGGAQVVAATLSSTASPTVANAGNVEDDLNLPWEHRRETIRNVLTDPLSQITYKHDSREGKILIAKYWQTVNSANRSDIRPPDDFQESDSFRSQPASLPDLQAWLELRVKDQNFDATLPSDESSSDEEHCRAKADLAQKAFDVVATKISKRGDATHQDAISDNRVLKAARKTKGSIELLNRAQKKRSAETPGDEHRESPARTGRTVTSVAATAVAATVATVVNPAAALLVASATAPAAAKAVSGALPWIPGIKNSAKARSPSRAKTPDRQQLIVPPLPDDWRAQDAEGSHSLALRPYNPAGDMLDPLKPKSWEKNMQEYQNVESDLDQFASINRLPREEWYIRGFS